MSKPVVAVVGRPNVGKSTFFNSLIGERLSIVDDTPGITRDRIFAESEWRGRKFSLIDTGGIEPKTDDLILREMRRQAELAIEMADVIILLVDLKTGLTADDADIAEMLRKSAKPVLVAVNKSDHVGDMPADAYEFYNLGLGDIFPISAVHRLGLGELLDAAFEYFPGEAENEAEDNRIKVAVIGKPNAGKSSLVNKLLGEDRAIVSDVPGTTRDAIDSELICEQGNFLLIDTAGLRKKSRIDENVERYSMVRSLAAIERADVCLIVIDAAEGVTEQDTKVAGYAHQAGKSCILAVNKWDLVDKETGTLENYQKQVRDRFGFMQYAPVIFISALTGQRTGKLLSLVKQVYEQGGKRLTTGMLNDVIAESVAMVPTPQDKGRHLKIYYATQVAVRPPQFVLFVNDAKLMHFSYERYLENQFRKNFGFTGTPIWFMLRGKEKK
ncbi:MAG: ribosome biogenesis GTPase Der [Eubacteriales bacterium]|jgi:GTP-binding protein|nr:ribosome biogenesis GTPase Der [Eubacteriales bacterium]MDD3197020.1 ribosome biogenesis GTPase Der [Eubacteriales bacterium]MDD3503538.1 ribosome biogenesis GTPase Der [Eubacteriales bacterium]MDD4681795.1 ribosome biogenesis GTPase Der [Eubacteriales bacterium]